VDGLRIRSHGRSARLRCAPPGLPTPDSSSCSQLGETSRAMLVDGTDDPINPYKGGVVTLFGFGNRGKAMSAKDSARIFAERNGITTRRDRADGPLVLDHRPRSDLTRDQGESHLLYTVHGVRGELKLRGAQILDAVLAVAVDAHQITPKRRWDVWGFRWLVQSAN
jgi:poly(3-hydroxybutyrate) depolymerase